MTEHPPFAGLDRRQFLRRAAALAAAATGSSVLGACATSGGGGGGSPAKPKSNGRADAKNPFGVDPKAPLDVVIFKGGFSDEYAKYHEKMYQKRYPQAKVHHLGTQEITAQLQPRFVNGNPPDVIDNSGAQDLDTATLVNQGQLTELADLLEAPSWDTAGKKVEDTVVEGTFDPLTFDGKIYGLPYAFNINGLWHDARLFGDNQWETPKTWDELMALGAKTKAKGIPLWTYQGQYPAYMLTVFNAMVQKHGGKEVLKNIDNLEDGAWQQQAVRDVAEAFFELKSKGYILPGTASLSHTQAQAAWLQRKAAIIPCGSWLKSEMKSQVPSDFEMTITPTPSLDDSDKFPYEAIPNTPTETFIVPSKAKNVPGGLEYLRIMLSKEGAQKFAELTYTLTVVKGAHEAQAQDPVLKSSLAALEAAQKVDRLDTPTYGTWYRPLTEEAEAAIGVLLTSKLDAKGFVDRVQRKADQVKKSNIKKFKR
ncbi:N-acetylglucosamine/diacetylchitobiose ABC transporter substrate-binding protein [Actinopolymorpha singaporensis]|uniref:N-acetylglucosamine transport system substrate-binding protein n=1 Tax=Actinopolymorpha singaporensis TaxID=117157 RepID=A0A1H1LEP1_9ACTN|nr:N-acetylglucosamine/diacetylchitobiose ABC transporter substrate-binding protein [Actinopolymorpha singaporensis]SDR72998.1 N-acetylglucosamine transport system substrate-binding protein [Actinopolymorpha singaporensis]